MKKSKLITLIVAMTFTFTSASSFSMPTAKKPPLAAEQMIQVN